MLFQIYPNLSSYLRVKMTGEKVNRKDNQINQRLLAFRFCRWYTEFDDAKQKVTNRIRKENNGMDVKRNKRFLGQNDTL